MAVITPTVTHLSKTVVEVIWANMHQNDTGAPASLPEFPFQTITARGTAGNCSVVVVGSDSADARAVTGWGFLHDSSGTAITALSVNDIKVIKDHPARVALWVNGGDGTTDYTVAILAYI